MRKVFDVLYLLYSGIIFLSLMVVVCPLIILGTALFSKRTGKHIAFFFLRIWAFLFSTLSFFWLRTRNAQKVDTSRSYIYTCNHNSYLDAVAVAYSMPQIVSPLGKIEMVKVPVFGWIYSRIVIMIDRSSKESREHSVALLKKEIESGISILIFPEGTMNRTEDLLAPFFDGAFRIAIETQTPILPFVVLNARELLPRKDPLLIRPGLVTTIFGDPIEVTGLSSTDVEQLKQQVFMAMQNLISAHKPTL